MPDDILLAPTPSAMWKFLIMCENFASNFNVTFNSLRSKSLIVKPLDFDTYIKCIFTLNTAENNAVIDNVSDFFYIWVIHFLPILFL